MKVKLPENMLHAVHIHLWQRWGYRPEEIPSTHDGYWANTDSGLEIAVWWIMQVALNPTPSHKEFDRIHNSKWCLYGEGERCRAASEAMRMILESRRSAFLLPEVDTNPLVMYIMRHFDDVEQDERSRRSRAEAAIKDYEEHLTRNPKTY